MLLQNAVKRKVGGEAVGAVLSIGRGAYFSKRKKKMLRSEVFHCEHGERLLSSSI